jgi:hypothetical protein
MALGVCPGSFHHRDESDRMTGLCLRRCLSPGVPDAEIAARRPAGSARFLGRSVGGRPRSAPPARLAPGPGAAAGGRHPATGGGRDAMRLPQSVRGGAMGAGTARGGPAGPGRARLAAGSQSLPPDPAPRLRRVGRGGVRAGPGAVADCRRRRPGRRGRPRRQDPAGHPGGYGTGGALGRRLRPPGRGGPRRGAESGQGTGTGGGQEGAGGGGGDRADGDRGRPLDPARPLYPDRGGGRRLPAAGGRQPTGALGRRRSGVFPPGRRPVRTGGDRRRPIRGWSPNWPGSAGG